MGKKVDGVDPEAMRRMEVYDWPGNVRELENTIERAVALESRDCITVEALPDRIRGHFQENGHSANNGGGANGERVPVLPEAGLDLETYIQNLERSYLLAALERCAGVRTHAADLLRMSYRSFRHYAKKYGV
jgi:two-component system response regulator PilR (NtrC family)